jgi:electron transfer DM13
VIVLRRRRARLVLAAAVLGVASVVFVLAYFEPQKLVIDDRVSEALPAPAAAAPAGETPRVRTLSRAPFRSYEHATSGRARVLVYADGRRYVRFENFRTSNGPALKVYLSAAPVSGPAGTFDDRYVDLGDLKGNIGPQNYSIPRDVRLGRYRSVVVWCKRFAVAFAAAALRAGA